MDKVSREERDYYNELASSLHQGTSSADIKNRFTPGTPCPNCGRRVAVFETGCECKSGRRRERKSFRT